MSEKFTPGPWSVTSKYEIGPVSKEDDQSYGFVIPLADVFGDNREANGRLIAAAPDLLTVSEHAIQWLQGDKWRFDEDPTKRESWEIMMRALKTAVAKARGES